MLDAPRMIPVLLLSGTGLYKTVGFDQRTYLGDPINIVRIFNEKEVDELCILDIDATRESRPPDYAYLTRLAEECFMPVSYGGGVRGLDEARRIIGGGFEKVVVNSRLAEAPEVVGDIAQVFGAQAVIASIDVRRCDDGRPMAWSHGASRPIGQDPVALARRLAGMGAGEILLTAVDRDGTMRGYDLDLVRSVADAVDVPVIACGGARSLDDLVAVVLDGHASAAAAGALFVFYGRRRGVLINPPTTEAFLQAVDRAAADRPQPSEPRP